MYGHQLFQGSVIKRVEYLNRELGIGEFGSLEDLAADIFIDLGELKQELASEGYYYVSGLNRFVRIELEKAG